MQLTQESHATLVRFGRAVAIVAIVGTGAWCLGAAPRIPMAVLCIYRCLVSLLCSLLLGEELAPSHFGRMDEAAWFFLLGHALRGAPHG